MSQYETLRDAIAQGVRRVKYEDKEVEYPSLASMRNLLAEMSASLGLDAAQVKRRVARMDRGL
jgi:hypothetical protein